MGKAQLTHGDSCRGKEARLYRIWRNMKSRCSNPNKPDYEYYGKQGIKVCDEWVDYITFKEWAIANGYQDNLTLDRREGDKNYCPENCRWITIKEQQNNKSNNHRIEFDGEIYTIAEWSEILNIKRDVIKDRLLAGWSVEKALTEPVQFQSKGITFNGETHSWREWSAITGISYNTLTGRYYEMGWDIEKTLTTPVKTKKKKLET